jgi:hypothetical protein
MVVEILSAGGWDGLENGRAMADRFAAYVGELTKVIGDADR